MPGIYSLKWTFQNKQNRIWPSQQFLIRYPSFTDVETEAQKGRWLMWDHRQNLRPLETYSHVFRCHFIVSSLLVTDKAPRCLSCSGAWFQTQKQKRIEIRCVKWMDQAGRWGKWTERHSISESESSYSPSGSCLLDSWA